MKINQISPLKHKYLQIVSDIDEAPKTLYYVGNLPEDRRPTVAIVGTRKPTAYGKEVTEKLARELAAKGIVVISGLALGVDGIAHAAALDAGGTTLAVLANGLSTVYPAAHRDLAEKIIQQGGALISEYSPDTPARSHQFLERNRIVSGLADAIIITEAAARSGTLNTAAHALTQGKEVFVVPGNITSPMSVGCNTLLKQGATPITSAEDVLNVIAPELLTSQTSLPLGSNELETDVIQLLANGERDGDQIQAKLNISATELSVALTMLEINGAIRSLGANQWTLR
jgi:DNA processing protein